MVLSAPPPGSVEPKRISACSCGGGVTVCVGVLVDVGTAVWVDVGTEVFVGTAVAVGAGGGAAPSLQALRPKLTTARSAAIAARRKNALRDVERGIAVLLVRGSEPQTLPPPVSPRNVAN